MSAPAWQRWTLLAALLALGIGYLCAFALFAGDSRDFIAAQHNRRALERARAAPVAAPATLSTGSQGAGTALLGGGWYAPEASGTWSSSKDSWIALAFRDARAGVALTLDTTAFVGERRHSRIVITADAANEGLGSWQRTNANPSEPLRLCVPAALAAQPVLLHLHVNRLASPLSIDAGPDTRTLGLALASITFEAGCTPPGSGAHAR